MHYSSVMKCQMSSDVPLPVPAGIVGALLLALICVIAALLWCLSRHKGSYVTNELDDDDDGADADAGGYDIDDDDEQFRSDIVLQIKEPLKRKDSE